MGIVAFARKNLRRTLSAKAYRFARFCWWHANFYLPHLLASRFVQCYPSVQGFPDSEASQLPRLLRSVNVFAPTAMCRVLTKHGSDKGQGWHNYATIYSVLFREFRDRTLRIFELGLGTANPNFAFNMGPDAQPGASLRGWREVFPDATIYGADIDREILFDEDRIKTFYCDQLDSDSIRDLWAQPALQGGIDIIIDDGLHTFEANTLFLEGSLEQLNPGGVYVIEDIFRGTIESRWRQQLDVYSKRWPTFEFAMVELPNSRNDKDNNNMLIIRREPSFSNALKEPSDRKRTWH